VDKEERREWRKRKLQTVAFVGALLLLILVISLSAIVQGNRRAEERQIATAVAGTRGAQATGTTQAERAQATRAVQGRPTMTAAAEKEATVQAQATILVQNWGGRLPVQAGTPVPQPRDTITAQMVPLMMELARWGQGWVREVAWSSDGRLLAVASSVGVHLYDAQTLEQVRYWESSDWVVSVAFSPDSTAVAGASYYRNDIRLWDVNSGEEMEGFSAPNFYGGYDITFSPDGTMLAGASALGRLILWDVATKAYEQTTLGEDLLTSLAFSPDSTLLAAGSLDGTVHLWNLTTGQIVDVPAGHGGDAIQTAFSPDGALLLSCAWGKKPQFWDVAALFDSSGEGEPLPLGPEEDSYGVAFSFDGTLLALGIENGTVQLWDIALGQEVGVLEGLTWPAESLAFSPDGARLMASALGERTVRLWQVRTGQESGRLEGFSWWQACTAFSPDGSLLAAAEADGLVRLWDVASGQVRQTLEGNADAVGSLAFSSDGRLLFAGTGGRPMRVWALSGELNQPGKITIWDVGTGAKLSPHILEEYQDVYGLALSPDGRTLAATICREHERQEDRGFACVDSHIRWWDLSTLDTSPAEANWGVLNVRASLGSLAFSPDGRLLAAGGEDGRIWVWETATWEEFLVMEAYTYPVDHLAFSPDGTLLASAGYEDGFVGLWEVDTGIQVQALWFYESGWLNELAFSPDGSLLAVATWDSLHFLGVGHNTGASGKLRTLDLSIDGVAFLPDGTLFATAGKDGTLRLWGIPR
jgi:WD40 repeat protein